MKLSILHLGALAVTLAVASPVGEAAQAGPATLAPPANPSSIPKFSAIPPGQVHSYTEPAEDAIVCKLPEGCGATPKDRHSKVTPRTRVEARAELGVTIQTIVPTKTPTSNSVLPTEFSRGADKSRSVIPSELLKPWLSKTEAQPIPTTTSSKLMFGRPVLPTNSQVEARAVPIQAAAPAGHVYKTKSGASVGDGMTYINRRSNVFVIETDATPTSTSSKFIFVHPLLPTFSQDEARDIPTTFVTSTSSRK